MKTCAVPLILLGLGLGGVTSANAQGACPPLASSPPMMTIKIFNDDSQYIFPVLTTGKSGTPVNAGVDIWLQAISKVPMNNIPQCPYPRTKAFRIYINPSTGIGPGKHVTITVPLYTQLVTTVNPITPNQYIDWWNGGTILLYHISVATPPRALTEDLSPTLRPGQVPVPPPVTGAFFPMCKGDCQPSQPLLFFSDDADLPKNDPSQQAEFTLGARVAQVVVNPATDPPNTLDVMNVDFDVSYVNLAHLPATMGPFGNAQVGYVGTPQSIGTFKAALRNFLTAFTDWPQFIRTYSTPPTPQTLLKLASPLEIFARLTGAAPPPDLTPLIPPQVWPTKLWTPIEALRTNWKTFAGKAGSPGTCLPTPSGTHFCDAIIDVKALMAANFAKYQTIFPSMCTGTPIPTLTDDILIAHVYGWAPFTESITSPGGCPAAANLLENTTLDYMANNFAKYAKVKLGFDQLNYGLFPDAKYVFNPWVVLIHGEKCDSAPKYVCAPNVYAYSVDDAVGNIQAEATGFIIDVGSTQHLENMMPAAPPIHINYAIGPQTIKMKNYSICSADAPKKLVNPNFQSFVISANNPKNCPIFFRDNKSPPQRYTFTITQPPPFTVFPTPAVPPFPTWTPTTAAVIDCSGNTGLPPYQQSSKAWCCELLAMGGNGVWAYSQPDTTSAHKSQIHTVVTNIAQQSTTNPNPSCSMGK
jgi:hypothetical protein